jgi:hypothetical protein
MKTRSRGFILFVLASLTLFATVLQARVCSGDGEMQGLYAFAASRGEFVAGLTGYPGLTSSSGTSSTPALYPGYGSLGVLGLAAGAGIGVPFDITGTVSADGSGGLFVVPSYATLGLTAAQISGLPAVVPVGTYTVTTDCTVTLTINTTTLQTDIAALSGTSTSSTTSSSGTSGTGTATGTTTTTTTTTTSSTTPATTATFLGVIEESASEIDFVQNDTVGGTGLRMLHTLSSGGNCNVGSLAGNYGVAGNIIVSATSSSTSTATTTTTSSGTYPSVSLYPVVGQLTADGAGNFVLTSATSAEVNQLVGTYTVNSDCAGVATLMVGPAVSSSSTTSTSTTGTSTTTTTTTTPTTPNPGQVGSTVIFEFVIARVPIPGPPTNNAYSELLLRFMGYGVGGGGAAQPE